MTVAEFVAGVRSRRTAEGRPAHLTEEVVYRLLDGILAHCAEGGRT